MAWLPSAVTSLRYRSSLIKNYILEYHVFKKYAFTLIEKRGTVSPSFLSIHIFIFQRPHEVFFRSSPVPTAPFPCCQELSHRFLQYRSEFLLSCCLLLLWCLPPSLQQLLLWYLLFCLLRLYLVLP